MQHVTSLTHTHILIHSTQKTVVTKNKPSLIAKHDCKLSHHQIQRYFGDKEKFTQQLCSASEYSIPLKEIVGNLNY